MPTPGGSFAAKKKLSAQGNNLTKYWGAPVSSSKKKTRGGGGSGSSSSMAAERSFEFGATPDRAPRGTAHHLHGGGDCGSVTMETTGGPAVKVGAGARNGRVKMLGCKECQEGRSFFFCLHRCLV